MLQAHAGWDDFKAQVDSQMTACPRIELTTAQLETLRGEVSAEAVCNAAATPGVDGNSNCTGDGGDGDDCDDGAATAIGAVVGIVVGIVVVVVIAYAPPEPPASSFAPHCPCHPLSPLSPPIFTHSPVCAQDDCL